MDFARLNPWNWLKEEEKQSSTSPAQTQGQGAPALSRSPLDSLHSEIDQVFNQAFRSFGLPLRGVRPTLPTMFDAGVFKPKVDIVGSEKEYTVTAELPGVDEKDINIEQQGNTLVIKAEKRQEEKSDDKGYYCIERRYGAYQRVLTLPADADTEAIKASCKNGVVTITMPRKASVESGAKRIPLA